MYTKQVVRYALASVVFVISFGLVTPLLAASSLEEVKACLHKAEYSLFLVSVRTVTVAARKGLPVKRRSPALERGCVESVTEPTV